MRRLEKEHHEKQKHTVLIFNPYADSGSLTYGLRGKVGNNFISFLYYYHNFTSTSLLSSCSVLGHRPRLFRLFDVPPPPTWRTELIAY